MCVLISIMDTFLIYVILVSCSMPKDPSSGKVTVRSNGTVSTAEYSCNFGYALIGESTRVCNTDGVWINSEPVCGMFLL